MIMSPFVVGMKVVCIKDGWKVTSGPSLSARDPNPVKGKIYTVAEVEVCGGCVLLRLEEIMTSLSGYKRLFGSTKFRPVKTVETDISIFTAMLNHANHREAVS
jgi:hypothetical protein